SLRVCLRLPAYSASAKVICFIGKLGEWSPGILPKSGSLLQSFLSGGCTPAVTLCRKLPYIALAGQAA
ncbi:hypothetical protein, partial [Stutzerimonas stutzeri]|uniref:hypothetical protein n=1 Tax=Stutzerimonas stutzeri TaxID=316 RepID=UPI001CA4ABFE